MYMKTHLSKRKSSVMLVVRPKIRLTSATKNPQKIVIKPKVEKPLKGRLIM